MLKPNSSKPLYQQIADIYTEAIHSGQYRPGDKLPSEHALCREYGVSRMTVRLALSRMVQDGLIQSIHGKGSFVRTPVLHYDTRKIVDFSETLRSRGLKGHTEIESCREADEPLLKGKCLNLNLLGYAGDSPFVLYRSYLVPELGEKMQAAAEAAAEAGKPFSTYELYRDMDQKPARVEQEISATDADGTLSAILHIPKGKAVLVVHSYYYDGQNRLIEFKRAYYRSDICMFRLQREI